jgi:hypothetical protein
VVKVPDPETGGALSVGGVIGFLGRRYTHMGTWLPGKTRANGLKMR